MRAPERLDLASAAGGSESSVGRVDFNLDTPVLRAGIFGLARIRQLLFAPNSPELAAALQFAVQAALQRYLGDLIQLADLAVTCEGSTLYVEIQYSRLGDNQIKIALLSRTV